MVLELLQVVTGLFLFFAAGYAISLAVLKKKGVDVVERIVYSIAFSLTIPPLVLFSLNYFLGLKVFETFAVYIIYLLIIGVSLVFSHFFAGQKLKLRDFLK